MSGPCSDAFRAMAGELGAFSCDAHPALSLRSPTALENWTLPVIEGLLVGGALAALAHAVRVRRRTGDGAALALWCAAVVYVLVLEPPLYFPHQLGFDQYVDLIFVHNVFSVDLLYDRMPLYIVALYPAGISLACAVVTRLGVFERRGRFVGAVCVGFTHHCFYAVFDHLGPQMRWWAWNPDAPVNRPALASVPLVSTVLFSLVGPALLAYAWRWLVAEPSARGPLSGGQLAVRSVATGVLTPLLLPVAGAPTSYLVLADDPDRAVMAVVLAAAVVAGAAVALPALARQGPDGPDGPPAAAGAAAGRFAVAYGAVYLAVLGALWLAALPDVARAEGGRTPSGAPVGSPAYVAACAALAVWLLHRTWSAGRADAASRA